MSTFAARPTKADVRAYARLLKVKTRVNNGQLEIVREPKSAGSARADNVMIVLPFGSLPVVPDDGKRAFERYISIQKSPTSLHTHQVLGISRSLAELGRRVTIVGQRFGDAPPVLKWRERVRIVRIPADGIRTIKKEKVPSREYTAKELWSRLKSFSSDAVAVAILIGADAVMGQYTFGGIIAKEVAVQREIPYVFVPELAGLKSGTMEDLPYSRLYAAEMAALDSANFVWSTGYELERIRRFHDAVPVPYYIQAPVGISDVFYEAHSTKPSASILKTKPLKKYNLQEREYLISWGPIQTKRNYPAQVEILAGLKEKFPEKYGDLKLVIVGGDPNHPMETDAIEAEKALKKVRKEYEAKGILREGDVVRIREMVFKRLAALAVHALAYLGTQDYSPFDRSPQENLAMGHTLTFVSKNSSIADQLRLRQAGVIIDPANTDASVNTINAFLSTPAISSDYIERGNIFAQQNFNWEGIGQLQAAVLDTLINRKDLQLPLAMNLFHRSWPSWQGGCVENDGLEFITTLVFEKLFTWRERFVQQGVNRRLLIGFLGKSTKELLHRIAQEFREVRITFAPLSKESVACLKRDDVGLLADFGVHKFRLKDLDNAGAADVHLGQKEVVLMDLGDTQDESLTDAVDIRVAVGEDRWQSHLVVDPDNYSKPFSMNHIPFFGAFNPFFPTLKSTG